MPHAPTATLDHRHAALRRTLSARGLDALVVTSLPNILYLTAFNGSAAIVVLTAERLYFITDFRYVTVVQNLGSPEATRLELVRVETSYDETLATVLTAMPGARIGFEAAHLTVSRHRWLESWLQGCGGSAPVLLPTEGVIEKARVCKDAYEISLLREAAHRLSAVAIETLRTVQRGQREREVAQSIDWRLREAGFERPAFDTIVASGPNAALPHARPGERTLTEGDLVVLDFGGVYDSYCVDLTRTVSIGPPSQRAREVHAAVREAHDRAIDAVRPGVSRFDIDGAARSVLDARGLGEAFGHGTGHGLGIEVHENPRITRRWERAGGRTEAGTPEQEDENDVAVAPGMVFTIEPGAYLPGCCGVRIEDDVLVTECGVDVLTNVPTDLVEL
jgi:Xaa-Pro aminopeptidase